MWFVNKYDKACLKIVSRSSRGSFGKDFFTVVRINISFLILI